jgi:hypothetical protein
LLLAARGDAQVNVAAMAGALQFDAGNDKRYFTWGLQVRYFATPVLRVGFIGGTAHIGEQPLKDWRAPGSDQRIWRGAGFVEVGTKNVHKVTASLRGMLGVFHSSGVTVLPPPPDPYGFYGITDTPTGFAYGLGAGLEVGPHYRMRLLAQFNFWFDQAYGGTGNDPEVLFGLGVDL